MKIIYVASLITATLIGLNLQSANGADGQPAGGTSGKPADTAKSGFHFQVGFSYASGNYTANDKLFDLYELDGFDITRINIPIGLVLNPYYEWITPIGGIGAGLSIGPTAMLMVDEQTYYSDDYNFSWVVPVGLFARYAPWPNAKFSPYVRAGFKYPFAGGNFEAAEAGPSVAVGVELFHNKSVGMSIEAGYDWSKINVKYTGQGYISGTVKESVTLPGFTVALAVTF
jgi:hypothetical protein